MCFIFLVFIKCIIWPTIKSFIMLQNTVKEDGKQLMKLSSINFFV